MSNLLTPTPTASSFATFSELSSVAPIHAHKKCPPITESDYEVWVPPLEDHIIALGYAFTVLALVIYVPQIITLIRTQTTVGVSITTMVINLVSGANQFWNVYLLDYYQIKACWEVGTEECMPHVQPIMQGFASFFIVSVLYTTALMVYARNDYDDDSSPEYDPVMYCWGLSRRKTIELWTVIGWTAIFSGLSVWFLFGYGACSPATITLAQTQGLLNSVLTIFQWWPQLVLTFMVKQQGSLSIIMLLTIEITDALSIYYYLALDQDWSVWLSAAVEIAMVSALLAMVIYFEICYRKDHPLPLQNHHRRQHHQNSEIDDAVDSHAKQCDSAADQQESKSLLGQPDGSAASELRHDDSDSPDSHVNLPIPSSKIES